MAHYPKRTLEPHLSTDELKQRYRACADAKEARRWHALWLFSTGIPIGEVADLVGMHRNWIRTVIKRYNADGPTAVIDTPTQQQELEQALAGPAPDGGLMKRTWSPGSVIMHRRPIQPLMDC